MATATVTTGIRFPVFVGLNEVDCAQGAMVDKERIPVPEPGRSCRLRYVLFPKLESDATSGAQGDDDDAAVRRNERGRESNILDRIDPMCSRYERMMD